jgi:hypothetical protein
MAVHDNGSHCEPSSTNAKTLNVGLGSFAVAPHSDEPVKPDDYAHGLAQARIQRADTKLD